MWIEIIWGTVTSTRPIPSRLARALWIEILGQLPNEFDACVEARESLVD